MILFLSGLRRKPVFIPFSDTECVALVVEHAHSVVFSSPEPKDHRWAYSICRLPASSVCRLYTFSNDFSSEAVRSILLIFHI